jgi:hypothetical protein
VGKAATALAEGAEKLGSKGADSATPGSAEHLEQLLQEPSQATATAGAGPAAGAAQAADAKATASQLTTSPLQISTLQANAAQPVSPGDKILQGIDQVRGETDQLVQEVGQISETGSGNGGKVSDLMSMQASLVDFEVTTQVGAKGMQETNQAVQTLLKGQ